MDVKIPAELVAKLRSAQKVVILTGAGVSAESNIPTFRDAMTGLWAKYSPEELATPTAFRSNPKLVWDWYMWRRDLVRDAQPNPGHYAIAKLAEKVPLLTLVTQNVDSLHQKAGSKDVLELHGNISKTKCFSNDHPIESWPETDQVPICPICESLLRPAVVWFGEGLPPDTLRKAMNESFTCDLFFSVGTSALVQPAASLIYRAMENGATTVEINPMGTPQSDQVDYALAGPSGVILPELLHQAWPS